jgi:hypothetical protein
VAGADAEEFPLHRLVGVNAKVFLELEGGLLAVADDLALGVVDVERGAEDLEDLAADGVFFA